MKRRQFLLGGMVLAGAGLAYGFGAEPRWLETRIAQVPLPRPLRSPVRILHLSDFHRSSLVALSFLERAVRMGLDQGPEMICLTGDFVTAGDTPALDGYVEVLGRLSARAPTYAVYGNHDGGRWSRSRGGDATVERVARLLDGAGVTILDNASASIETSGGPLRLIGVADLWSGRFDPGVAFAAVARDEAIPTVLLAHNPDTKDRVGDRAWDLMLSGHTHGGQVVIPFIGPPFVPVHDRRFIAGLNPWGRRWIYTTRGVGNLYGIRINCRPEVTILELT
jgi:predicted MPP superfamily phosphohydrolase